MHVVFWLALLLISYSYIVYPLIIYCLPSSRATVKTPTKVTNPSLNIAIVIAAYNEELDIVERVENLLALDYPDNLYTIYLGSDGSSDSTNTLVTSLNVSNKKLKFYPFKERRGKASVLNDLCSKAKEEIIVFSDANTLFEPDALQNLVSHFENDECIGGVCGELKIHSANSKENSDGIYWEYEQFLKVNEGKINGLLGANGAIYAIRKELYQELDEKTIVDDFMIAMNVVMQGYRLVYEPNAVAHEYAPESMGHEFNRRVRIGSGNYQAFMWLKRMWNPFASGVYTFTYLSHKVLRWFTPHLLVLCIVINVFLLGSPFYLALFIIQIALYFLSIFCLVTSSAHKLPKLLSLLVFFINMNIALLVGFFKFLSSNLNPAWERTTR